MYVERVGRSMQSGCRSPVRQGSKWQKGTERHPDILGLFIQINVLYMIELKAAKTCMVVP